MSPARPCVIVRIRQALGRWSAGAQPAFRGGRTLGFLLVLVVGLASCASSWPGSVGAVFAKDNRAGRVYVREVPPDMGAARAGLREGDEVTAIDGRSVRTMSPEEVHRALAGNVGTSVTLTVVRDGEPRQIKIERGPLKGPPAH